MLPLFRISTALLLLAAILVAQGRDERKIKKLEGVVAKAEATLGQQRAALRKIYRELEDSLARCQDDQGAKARADLGRVLEPAIAKARTLAGSGTKLNRTRVVTELKKAVPRAVSNVEHESLVLLKDYLPRRILGVMRESGNVLDSLQLDLDDLSRRVLKEILDFDTAFHIRWNAYLSTVLGPAEEYRKAHTAAEEARLDLAEAKDPFLRFQRHAPTGFAWVPAGTYQVRFSGPYASTGLRKRPRRVSIPKRVLVGLREVTQGEYYDWLKDQDRDFFVKHEPRTRVDNKKRDVTPLWPFNEDEGRNVPDPERRNHPVTGVSLESALLYARARNARLPTEAEWYATAAGATNRQWPWGDEYKAELANDREAGRKDTVPVGSYELGRGPYGHYDLAGNVSEWTLTYESTKDIVPDPAEIDRGVNCIIRGGSFLKGADSIRTDWIWLRRTHEDWGSDLGFRLAMDDPGK